MHHQWECLDLDVVFLVLDKLLEPIDRASFGVVCKEWGRLARAYKRWCKRKVLPMLLIPSNYDGSRQQWRHGKKRRRRRRPKHQGLLYSILERRIYSHVQTIMLPSVTVSKQRHGCSRYYRGCGHGWVAMIDMNEFRREAIITLVNPFTTAMLQSFPPLKVHGWGIPKVILSEDPTLNDQDNYVVVAFSDGDCLDSIKGRQDWYHIEFKPYLAEFDFCEFTDAIFYRGQIYIADLGIIAVSDYKSKQQMYLKKLCTVPFQNLSQQAKRAYLAESIKGDLLYIQRFTTCKSSDEGQVTENFRVYKMVLNGSIMEFVEVKSIGDEALFVGDSHSVSFLASSSSGCQPNSIYFTDDSINFCLYLDNYGGRPALDENIEVQVDMGIFHLEDGTISQHYPKYSFDGTLLPPAFWIIPPAV